MLELASSTWFSIAFLSLPFFPHSFPCSIIHSSFLLTSRDLRKIISLLVYVFCVYMCTALQAHCGKRVVIRGQRP